MKVVLELDPKTARTLTTITPEQWSAISAVSQQFSTLKVENKEMGRGFKKAKVKICDEEELQIKVKKLLQKLGAIPNVKGYKYIMTAVMLAYEDDGYLDMITKRLYPDISKMYEAATPGRVERGIRHLIEILYERGNATILKEVFGQKYSEKNKPTNSYVIATMVEYLKMNK